MIILFLIIQLLFILYLNKLRSKKKINLTINRIAILSSLLTYIIIVTFAVYLSFKYQSELDAFDLNKDGLFSSNEINEEQQKAMKNMISDSGRTLAPITGILFSVVYYIILLSILLLIDKVSKNHRRINI